MTHAYLSSVSRRVIAVLVALLLLGGGGAAAAALLGARHDRASAPTAPYVACHADRVLDHLRPPRGARRVRHAPRHDGGLLHQPQSVPGNEDYADSTRLWVVHKSLGEARSIERHLPSGAQVESSGSAGGPNVPQNELDNYALPSSGDDSACWITLAFVSLPNGWTGIRADAQVGYGTGVTH
jgi:hypothetical protein